MRYPWFIVGFCASTVIFVSVNVADYFRERAEYYRFLEESGWVWAGSWTWGFPFVMAIEGLGTEAEKYSLISPGAILNLIICLAVAGCVGITMEFLRSKFWPVTS
jgi:hypothetical protein